MDAKGKAPPIVMADVVAEMRYICVTAASTLGDTHPTTLLLQNNFGFFLMHQLGGIREAIQVFRSVISLSESKRHPTVLLAANNLATALDQVGANIDALEQYKMVVHMRTISLGKDHELTLTSKQNLAKFHFDLYAESGDHRDLKAAIYLGDELRDQVHRLGFWTQYRTDYRR